ncbi:MAG: hypothetical protein COB09_18720 [Thalassobium sp.]|nr:MAG: hypothetical protein COB09_18720 [Thalassobium sp.]
MKQNIKNFLALKVDDLNFRDMLGVLKLDQGITLKIVNGCVWLNGCTEDVQLRPNEVMVLWHVTNHIKWSKDESDRKAQILKSLIDDIEAWDEEEQELLEQHYKEKYCNTKL